ncbi:RNA 2',3'-cyclic phosphodiesterase [Qipengyuania zhejiangensis]|uniref:RNA 2',3'-cyclic phosphodiesterase n=1 Tax=Qipengyuania zhejiangensis TaxID=3077782 RepID=UPI002D794CDD|nr:RNA 2',3'-cyclic phosphodiesterase [Qipengyuania sp. Z2]
MSHRLFVALRPPGFLREALLDQMEGVEGARWQDDGQLHLTLRYVGDLERNEANDLAEALATIRFDPFELTIAGTGAFERKGMVHTLWAGVAPSEPLRALQRRVERVCQSAGLAGETRKFAPHITLARLNASSGPVTAFLTRTARLNLGGWLVDFYTLYESHLRAEGSLYTPVVRYPCQ